MDSQSRSNVFPGFDHVYLIGEGPGEAFRVSLDLSGSDDVAFTRGERHPDRPIIGKWYMGRRVPSDVIWPGNVIPMIVSERVVELLTKIGARGWSTLDVELFGKNGEVIRGYYGFAIHGRCGPIDNSKSVPIMKAYPGGIFPEWKGVYFDPETWDGSHLFMTVQGGGWMFAVDEVKRAFEKAKVKNISFKPLTEITRSEVAMRVHTRASTKE